MVIQSILQDKKDKKLGMYMPRIYPMDKLVAGEDFAVDVINTPTENGTDTYMVCVQFTRN